MNYEGIAELLYEAWGVSLEEQGQDAYIEVWRKLPARERAAWIAVAKRAHEVLAAAVGV